MSSNQLTSESKRRAEAKQFNYKVVKTTLVILLWITCGLFVSMAGTTLVDFKRILQTDFDALGTVMLIRTIGYMIGSMVASLIRDKAGVQSELIVAVAAALCSVANFWKPWSRDIYLFAALNAVEGFGQSCMSTVINALILELWGRKASMPIHIFHFGFGLGAFLGPLLAKDYLSVLCPPHNDLNKTAEWHPGADNSTGYDAAFGCWNSTLSNPIILQQGRLEIPFSIIGSLLMTISFAHVVFYSLEKWRFPHFKVERKEKLDEKPVTQSKCSFMKSFFFRFSIGLFLMYVCITSFETVVYNYLFTFAFESGTGFTKPEAAYLSSAYWGSYTMSRLLASVIAHFVSVKLMIFVEMLGTLASLLLMLFLGFQSKVGMWASACLLGIFSAPVWPSGIAFADRYVQVRASVTALMDVGSGIGGSVCMWLAGHLVQINLMRSYLYVASVGCICTLVLLTLLQIGGFRHGDRHIKRKHICVTYNTDQKLG